MCKQWFIVAIPARNYYTHFKNYLNYLYSHKTLPHVVLVPIQKTKDRATRAPLNTRTVSSSCSTSGTRRVTIVTNPVISHEWRKNREVLTTSGAYTWSFVTRCYIIHVDGVTVDCKHFSTMDNRISNSLTYFRCQ